MSFGVNLYRSRLLRQKFTPKDIETMRLINNIPIRILHELVEWINNNAINL